MSGEGKGTSLVPGVLRPGAAMAMPQGDGAIFEFLAFRLATEIYALPLAGVQEILKPPHITEVPRAPADVLGIVSVRGRITTVLDLRRRLGLVEGPIDARTRILLVRTAEEVVGLLVDAVLQVYRLYEDEVELASSLGGDTSDYVMGIGRPRAVRTLGRSTSQERDAVSDILILLDAEPLLSR